MERRVGRIMNRSPFTGQQQCEERTCKIPYPGGEFLIPTRSGIKFVCCPWRRTLLVQFWYSTGIIKARLMSEPFLSYMEILVARERYRFSPHDANLRYFLRSFA